MEPLRDLSTVETCVYIVRNYTYPIKKYQTTYQNLCVPIEQFHSSIREGIVTAEKNLYLRTQTFLLKKMKGRNFSSLY